MTNVLLAYIPCKDITEAEQIGSELLKRKLCGCINIIPEITSMYPYHGTMQKEKEVVLIAKTIEENYAKLETAVEELHSYETPCVIAIPAAHINRKYYDWLVGEIQ
ncbi:divalent-cation tolerance protein CutA [Candidatus Roizmanbacteria bacterium]|nr:divalent-cation tolerance protein CutA [Candidatus Roizmanbacteria bacterium]